MKIVYPLVSVSLMLAGALAAPVVSGQTSPAWLTRCSREIGANNDLETAKYIFQTAGKAEGAQGRAELDYTAKGFATQTIYPTTAKDLMNPYSGASLGVGHHGVVDGKAPHASTPKLGRVSLGAIGKDFKPIPGGGVKMKLVVDGKSFGPYEPKASSLDFGQYSVWLDTAESDGDGKPPILSPAEFASLAKAIDAMKAAEIVLERDGADIVRMPVTVTKFAAMRDGLPVWAAATRPTVKEFASCLTDDKPVN
jgi:hypothetical protein